jgi:hypothetical protein
MAEEHVRLREALVALVRDLLDPADRNGDTRPDHPPVNEVSVGLVSPDLGTAGHDVPGCAAAVDGRAGCFAHAPVAGPPECAEAYPPFLCRDRRNDWRYSADDLLRDFGCLADLGTAGCPFEQSFRAMLRAVRENAAPGGCNEGFVQTDSILALIWVTDEDDCSVREDHPEMFDPEAPLGSVGTRCALHPELLDGLEAYVHAFRDLRAENPERLVLGMIVGVPPDLPACRGSGDMLEGCLESVPAMTPAVAPLDPTRLIPSCETSVGLAYPPRRFVELAQAFGNAAYVESICREDWSEAMRGITDRIPERFESRCYPRELELDVAACATPCTVVMTRYDDRPCEPDPDCPAGWCPPARREDVGRLVRCRDPATGEACVPLMRDLGVVRDRDGRLRRECLLRQAARRFDADAGRCGDPLEEGWYYLPPEWRQEGCPWIEIDHGGRDSFVGPGDQLALHCFTRLCSDEEPCGPAAAPRALVCRGGETCLRTGGPERQGTCVAP